VNLSSRIRPAIPTIVAALVAASAGVLAVTSGCSSGAATASNQPSPARTQASIRPVSAGRIADIVSGSFTTKTPEPAFLRMPRDDSGHVSYKVGTLKIRHPQALPVYLLGGSNVRECIETPASLQKALQAAAGVPTTVVDLGSSDQTPGETMAVIDNLPAGRGVVAIAVNHSRFAYAPAVIEHQIQGFTLLMKSTALWRFTLNAEGLAPRNSISSGVAAYLADWRKRNAATLAAGKKPWHVYQPHRYTSALSLAAKRALVTKWLTGKGKAGGAFSRYHAFDAKVLQATVKLAVSRGFSVVLMQAPANLAVMSHKFEPYTKVYVPACESIAAAGGGIYIDVNAAARFVDSDFHDLTHLLTSGRTKWTAALATALAPVVGDAASASPAP
jgi:hypothetical protein